MNASIASNEEAQSRPPQLKMNSGQAVRQPLWLAYVLAVVSTVATIILALVLDSGALNRPTLILFVIPIILSAYVGGGGPGLVSTLLAAVSTYSFLRPADIPSSVISFDFVRWLTLVIAGVLISLLNEALHRSRVRAETSERLRLAENT